MINYSELKYNIIGPKCIKKKSVRKSECERDIAVLLQTSECVGIPECATLVHIISSTILSFLPDNLKDFYTINTQKANFSSNCAYIFPQIAPTMQGTLLTFLPDSLVCL